MLEKMILDNQKLHKQHPCSSKTVITMVGGSLQLNKKIHIFLHKILGQTIGARIVGFVFTLSDAIKLSFHVLC